MQKVGALRQTRHTVLWFVSLLTVGGLALGTGASTRLWQRPVHA